MAPLSGLQVVSQTATNVLIQWTPQPGGVLASVFRMSKVPGGWSGPLNITLGPIFGNSYLDATSGHGSFNATSGQRYLYYVTAPSVDTTPSNMVEAVFLNTIPVGGGSARPSIEEALYEWASQSLARLAPAILATVIFQNENGPRPDKPYVAIKIQGPTKVGSIDDERVVEGEFTQSGIRSVPITVAAYGEQAFDLITFLQTALEFNVDLLLAHGFGVGPINPAVDLTQLLDTQFEKRVQFDFELFVPNNVSIGGGGMEAIESVESPGQLGDNETTVEAVKTGD
jgi:hypothetical protein